MGPPKIRVSASPAANAVKYSAAIAAVCPWPFRIARVSQLFAAPSPSSTPSMTTPMSSSRQSSQPRSHWRSLARRSCGGCPAGARLPCGIPAAVPRAAAAMRTASAMSCAEGEMPRAAQAAAIPAPTATPMDQAACIIGMRVRPAACSTAEPSTLISTSRMPIPSPTITKPTATSGTEPRMSARPMTAIAAAMSRSAPAIGPAASQPVQDRGRREQPEDGPDGHSRQEQPDRGRVDAEARLDSRQPRTPRRDGDPAQPERSSDRPPPAGQTRASGATTDASPARLPLKTFQWKVSRCRG